MIRVTRSLAVLCLLIVVAGWVASPAAAAPGSNAPNAKLCQKGGWVQVEGTDGTRFGSQDACVSYSAHGGTLQDIPAMLTLTSNTIDGSQSPAVNAFVVSGTGFIPNVSITLTGITDTGHTYRISSNYVQTDGTGAFVARPISWLCGWSVGTVNTISATDGVSTASVDQPILC